MIGRQIHGSLTKDIRLSEKSANPALLNAETAWNTPSHTDRPSDSSYPKKKRAVSASATTSSMTRVTCRTPLSTRRTSPIWMVLVSVAALSRARSPSRRATRIPSSEARVMIPKPPI